LFISISFFEKTSFAQKFGYFAKFLTFVLFNTANFLRVFFKCCQELVFFWQFPFFYAFSRFFPPFYNFFSISLKWKRFIISLSPPFSSFLDHRGKGDRF